MSGAIAVTTKASHRRAWKKKESQVAAYIGGERVPITGRQRGDVPDIKHAWLCPEVKYREKISEFLHDAMRQAIAAKRGRQMPCVILCEKGQHVRESYIMFRLEDARDHWL